MLLNGGYVRVWAQVLVAVTTSSFWVYQCSGQVDRNCQRPAQHVDECPYYILPPTIRTEQECMDDGCYFCSGLTPSCVEGVGCAAVDQSAATECKNGRYRILSKKKCREMGCSWCAGRPTFRCVKNPTSLDDIIFPPTSSYLNCVTDPSLRVECDYLAPQRTNAKTNCWASGCHWCSAYTPSCIQGQVCLTQKSTGEYDCRVYPNEIIERNQCLKRGCSWCPSNTAFQCVRDQPAGQSDLTCQRQAGEYVECPSYTTVPVVRNEQECRDDGCYYCSGLTPTCVQGTGCSWIDMTAANECKTSSGNTITSRKLCRDQGCSWCEHHAGIKCFLNAASNGQVVSVPPPYAAACTISSSLRVQCPYVQPMYAGTATQCWLSGCHWCPSASESISCIQGEVCGSPKTGPEYDCRDSTSEILSPYECIQRGCSWCQDNVAYQCVRNIPDAALAPCIGSLKCFPFPTDAGVTEAQCNDEYRCSYCSTAPTTHRCMRDGCPVGYQLRYDGESCCQSETVIPPEVKPPIPSDAPRIINGAVSAEGRWPWAAFYVYGIGTTLFSCGAFIVAPKRVLTAAHCQARNPLTFEIIGPGSGYVVVGANDYTSPLSTNIDVADAIPHPWFSDPIPIHDVMVLKLWNPVPSSLTPLQLPLGEFPVPGMTCYVAGWGVTDPSTVPPGTTTTLLEAAAVIFPTTVCSGFYVIFDENYILCAGGTSETTCSGDSGGALMCQRCSSCAWYAVGITSFGLPAGTAPCSPTIPGFFAKVDAYQTFFQDHGVPISSQTYSCPSI